MMEQEEKAQEEQRLKNQEQQKYLQEQLEKVKKQIVEDKKQLASELKQDLKQKLDDAADLKLIEQVERQNYIKQLKAMLEVQSAKRVEYLANKFDPSTIVDQGLFN